MSQYEAILLDIEGTTTSISFVYDTLFPYAREHVKTFLDANWEDPNVRRDVELLRLQARDDRDDELGDVVMIPDGDVEDSLDAVVENFLWQMDNDRKTSGLKSLQGKIWRDGYASGELKAHLFDDVLPAFERWRDAGIEIYIYSSGSVAAQRLLFSHTEHGDLTPMIAGYFDTITGPKKDPDSYSIIAESLRVAPEHIRFATDNLEEARAARDAGFDVVVMERPGNPELGDHDFETRGDFKSVD